MTSYRTQFIASSQVNYEATTLSLALENGKLDNEQKKSLALTLLLHRTKIAPF